MSLTFVALALSAATHSIPIQHHGLSMQAVYTARADIQTRTVGAATPNRSDSRRCHWTARIMVDRRLDHGPALARTVGSAGTLTGSVPHACSGNADSIAQAVAARTSSFDNRIRAVAERDRTVLLAELDAVRNLASN